MPQFNKIACDVLVAGSGAAGLSAAITARLNGLEVIVAEKQEVFGGTTARSGGWLWIPCNPIGRAAGIGDSLEMARTYLQHEAGNNFDADKVDAFLTFGPRMVEFMVDNTAVKFEMGPLFPDYHPDAPGGSAGGRSIIASPFDARELGSNASNLAPPIPEQTLGGVMIGAHNVHHFFRARRSLRSAAYVGWQFLHHFNDMRRYGRPIRLTNGNALTARLAKSTFDLGIPLRLGSPVRQLLVGDGRITGAVVEQGGRAVEIIARRGVVLACGGFSHDVTRRQDLYAHPSGNGEHLSAAALGNTGDGISLAESVGGQMIGGLSDAAAWAPVSRVVRSDGSEGVFPHFVDRSKPGVIAITSAGVRFVNEANSYHDFIRALVGAVPPGAETAAYLICDHCTIRRYGLGMARPAPFPLKRHVRSGYLVRARSITELANGTGIDSQGLIATIETFNRFAHNGDDPEFGRGSTAYNRFQGDARHRPNPCVAPIERAPFYAVKVLSGDLGTFAGLSTDRSARVLRENEEPIAGLYAVGNDMASIMGGQYPGSGINLGPAMTFGFLAGLHLAGDDS